MNRWSDRQRVAASAQTWRRWLVYAAARATFGLALLFGPNAEASGFLRTIEVTGAGVLGISALLCLSYAAMQLLGTPSCPAVSPAGEGPS